MHLQPSQYIPFLVLIPVIGLIVWRNSQARRLRVEAMWVRPAIIAAVAVWVMSRQPPATALMIGLCALALVVGAGLGWLRGKMMRISVDPETHLASVQGSPLAVLFILVLIGVRYAARSLMTSGGAITQGHVSQFTDVLLLFGVGVIGAQGLEMWLRARRLISGSKAAKGI